MEFEEGKENLGRVLSSHALRSMWSGIKAQQNGMKELIPSTDRETVRWGFVGKSPKWSSDYLQAESKNLHSKKWLQNSNTSTKWVNKTVAIKQCNTPWSYPSGVGLVELVEHDHRRAAVIEDQPPEVGRGAGQRVRRHDERGLSVEAVGESSVDVIVALPFWGDQEGQGAIRRQDVHAAVLLPVSGQQGDAALLHIQVGSHRVEGLQMEKLKRRGGKLHNI